MDPTTATTPVTLTFSNVTQAGNTTLTTSGVGPPPPSGFKLGNPPTYYQLATTAVYSGPITICISYAGINFQNPNQLAIWHNDPIAGWTQLPTTIDTATTTVCAITPSLSPFAILEPAYVAQVQPPISADGSTVFKAGRGVVPVKFTLSLGGVPTCSLPPATISLSITSGTSPGPITQNEYAMPSDSGSNFRIDTTGCQYVYNLGTGSLGPGTYLVQITISNGVVGSATFGLN